MIIIHRTFIRPITLLIPYLLLVVSQLCLASPPHISLVTEHLPPYQIINKDDEVTGVSTDIIKEVMKRSQYSYSIDAYSWMRSYNLAQNKENHCIYSIARLPSREKLFTWVGAITEVNNAVIWGLKKDNIEAQTLEEIKKYTTAVNKNDATHLGLVDRGFEENKHLYVLNNTKSLITLLVTRPEIDLIVADDITIGYRAELVGVKKSQLKRVYEVKGLALDFHLACSNKTDKKIISTLTKNLNQIHQDGSYRRILNKWQQQLPTNILESVNKREN